MIESRALRVAPPPAKLVSCKGLRRFGLFRDLGLYKSKKYCYNSDIMHHFKNIKYGFTLAEVLITLGIIGVVAAMTMPSLIASHKEKETVSKLKKVYSTLSNAFLLADEKYGTPDNWELIEYDSPEGANNLLSKLAEFMNVAKYCGNAPGCNIDVQYRYLNGSKYNYDLDSNTTYAKLLLADGTMLAVNIREPDCKQERGNSAVLKNVCGTFSIDINGPKPPNQIGRDRFGFILSKYGVIPHGSEQETMYTFDNSCKDISTHQGFGCTAWVIFNENLDYMHCNDLDWKDKTKCK